MYILSMVTHCMYISQSGTGMLQGTFSVCDAPHVECECMSLMSCVYMTAYGVLFFSIFVAFDASL